MKPSFADTARAYLLPAIATVCSAQVAMLFAMLLLDTPESVFQGPMFRCGVVLAMVVAIVSVRRRAGRAFYAARRSGTVRMRRGIASSGRGTELVGVRLNASGMRGAPPVPATSPSEVYFSVAASCPERALVVLYLQFRRMPFAIESRERDFAAPTARHA